MRPAKGPQAEYQRQGLARRVGRGIWRTTDRVK